MHRSSSRAWLVVLAVVILLAAVVLACVFCGGTGLWLTPIPQPVATVSSPAVAVPTLGVTAPTAGATRMAHTPAPSARPTVAGAQRSDWLRARAIPLQAVEPYEGDDFSDLLPLKDLIGDARIVALGEATHGTREFFTLKHRLVRFLVQEMGFNLFAIEDNWAEAESLNDYVLNGGGDAATALSNGLGYWTWSTQEVLDMVVWMGEHNENPGGAPTVSFQGFDMNTEQTLAIDTVVRFFEEVDAEYAPRAKANYACFYAEDVGAWYSELSVGEQETCRAGLQAVMDTLVENRESYLALATAEAYQLAKQSARVVLQAEEVFQDPLAWPSPRDAHMAENVRWLLERAGPEAKIVLWAHNGHVGSVDPEDNWAFSGMGHYLRQTYGDAYFVIGFAFGEGAVTAIGADERLGTHTVPPPPPETFEWYARETRLPAFVLGLRGLDLGQPDAAWLSQPVLLRSIGSMYDPSAPDDWFFEHDLPRAFDALIYIDRTSATRLLW